MDTKDLNRRDFLKGVLLCSVPLLTPTTWAKTATNVLAVRLWPAAEYTRLTLELNHPNTAAVHLLHHPNRLAIDFKGIQTTEKFQQLIAKLKHHDPFIAKIRVGQFTPDTVRIVLDLKQAIRLPQPTYLKPIGQYKYRTVIDLYPVHEIDPIADFAKQLSQQHITDDDPIADLIRSGQPSMSAPSTPTPHKPPATTKKSPQTLVITIDPGHGGEDPGAIGMRGTREKDIVLSIAKRLRRLINQEQGMRAYMTRDRDYFVPLGTRVQKSLRVKAGLFVSIHADAFINRKAKGTSVFTLSSHGASSTAARWLAKKENGADIIGGMSIGQVDRETKASLLDLATSQQISDSLVFGNKVFHSLGRINGISSRQVEQANFAVLKSPQTPSILVETAFISNPKEELFLRSSTNQQKIAQAILAGIKQYLATNPTIQRV